jgi:hypothetical protein
VPLIGGLLGVRVRHVTAWEEGRPTICCALSTVGAAAVGEVRIVRAHPKDRFGLRSVLSYAGTWFGRTGRTGMHVYVSADRPHLTGLMDDLGAVTRHTWTRVACDLEAWESQEDCGTEAP